MLSQLYVNNFAIAESVEANFHKGMTVITGETGAGKSILLDAIGLALGDRANSDSIGPFGDKAEITAVFDITKNAEALSWLEERELNIDEACILRRVLSKDGKSKAYINNRPCPVSDVKELGEQLINIHGQHAHQLLLKSNYQRNVLDNFGGYSKTLTAVGKAFNEWQELLDKLMRLRNSEADAATRVDFLKFQLEELGEAPLPKERFDELEGELQTLSHAGTVIELGQQIEAILTDEAGAVSSLKRAAQLIGEFPIKHTALSEASEMLDSAVIQAEESASTIQHYHSSVEIDEQRLRQLDEQFGAIFSLARKHRVEPKELHDHQQQLIAELESLDASDEKLAELEQSVQDAEKAYRDNAEKLTTLRKKASHKLGAEIESRLDALRMGHCHIEFAIEATEPSALGLEKVILKAATNPGQAAQAIAKIASGGELSRIGLAIQVVTAQSHSVPALIFDEVDSGVGGAVAEVVGDLMRELSNEAQIFCVTHLPQVASKASNHYIVSKDVGSDSVKTNFTELEKESRVDELARMLGGVNISEQTLAHAKEMLAN